MAINFPSSPADGAEYTDPNSGTWVYDSGTNSWTLTAGGSASAFNFRGGHDFRSSTPPADPIESGDMWIHDAADGTIDGVYTGISGQIANGQLVLWDGNSYVMISGTLPGYPDVGDGEGGTLDSRYLKLGAGAGAQTVQSTDTTTFNGLVEAGRGAEVAGGNVSSITTGLFSTNVNNLHLQANDGNGSILFKSNTVGMPTLETATKLGIVDTIPSNAAYCVGISTEIQCETGGKNIYNMLSNFDSDASVPLSYTGFFCRLVNAGAKEVTNSWMGFRSLISGQLTTDLVVGFQGDINKGNATGDAFNFYAGGNADNFFLGDTYIGGTATRNTRELWESTLTEEQKEQLSAGTLAIPANVSTPGDGSFVRQWWYNQQSVEDQALIDAGELEYPERYQAANFVDTFALGTDTNIDLLSTGAANFAGNVDAASFTVNGTPLSATVESLQTLVATLQTRIEALEAAGNGGY